MAQATNTTGRVTGVGHDTRCICTYDCYDQVRYLWIDGRLEGGIDAKLCGRNANNSVLNGNRGKYRLQTPFRVGQILGDINGLSVDVYEAITKQSQDRVAKVIQEFYEK